MGRKIRMTKPYTYKPNPRLKRFAKKFGIEIRVSELPSEAGIIGVDKTWAEHPGVYSIGTGVIWLKKTQKMCKADADIMFAHEIGHAIMDLFPWAKQTSEKMHEVMANTVALLLAAEMNLPISKRLLKGLMHYPSTKALRIDLSKI